MLELITAQNLALLQDFEGVHLLGVLLLNEEHLAVATLADDLDLAEVAHGDGACLRLLPIAELLHLVHVLLIRCSLPIQQKSRQHPHPGRFEQIRRLSR